MKGGHGHSHSAPPQPKQGSLDKPLYVVVVYHLTIAATGHGLLNIFGSMVTDSVLRTAGNFLYL